MMDFTNDELFLISIYNTGDRKNTMEEIREMRSYLEEDEIELTELTESVLRKLEGINDEEYDLLDLIPEFDE